MDVLHRLRKGRRRSRRLRLRLALEVLKQAHNKFGQLIHLRELSVRREYVSC